MVLIAAVLISTLQSKQKSASQTQENSNNSILVTSPALTASENAIQKATIPNYGQWVSGSFAYNNINYPSTWQQETNNILSGGSTVTLLPSHLTNGDLLPRVHIEVSPLDPKNPISRIIESLAPLGLTKTTTSFHGISAVKLSGQIPFKPLPENPNQSYIYKNYLLLEKSNNKYIITYAYYEDANQSKNEQLIKLMLDSFQFK